MRQTSRILLGVVIGIVLALRCTSACADIQLSPWHAIGPFKNAQFGSLVPSSKEVYAPEAEVLAKGAALAELSKSYNGVNIDYQRVVQPVWNRYCVSCHRGAKPKGHIDLSADPDGSQNPLSRRAPVSFLRSPLLIFLLSYGHV